MLARSRLRLRTHRTVLLAHRSLRRTPHLLQQKPVIPGETSSSPRPSTSWLAQRAEKSPFTKSLVLKLASLLGYNRPKQVAQRRAFVIYTQSIKDIPDSELDFWHNQCSLPPTFQTWFTVTNLHIWLVTVRLRALPPPHGRHFIQGLIDHFFQDVEDRIRARLSKRVSERIVTRHLKTCRDQWQGLGMSLDYGLLTSDADLAGTVWRNFLGARGALGIEGRGQAVNYAGLAKPPTPEQLERNPEADDGSGVRDFEGEERHKYVEFPELMWMLTSYIRREIARLESIPDDAIMRADIGPFSSIIRDVDPLFTSNTHSSS